MARYVVMQGEGACLAIQAWPDRSLLWYLWVNQILLSVKENASGIEQYCLLYHQVFAIFASQLEIFCSFNN